MVDAGIDLGRRYSIAYGAGHGAALERLAGVRIVGTLRRDRDQATGEYMDGRWLVVELSDRRRA